MTSESPSIELHTVFPSIKELKHMVKKHALYSNFEIHTIRSNSTRYIIECKDNACSWQLRAFPDGASEWKIKQLSTSHECIGVRGPSNKSANAKFVATEMLELFRLQPDMTPINIINEIHRSHHIKISYDIAWEARELARTMINGTYEESYVSLPSYCKQLIEANPGSFVSLEKTTTNQFQRLFVSYYASAKGFTHCKPLIGLDGTHLRSKYQGILLTATATDAQGQLFPLAFGVVDIEDKANWIWFLQKLRDVLVEYDPAIVDQENVLVLLSDRAKGLLDGVPLVFPLAAHGYCLKHLEKNLKAQYKDPKLTTFLWQMAASKTPRDFEEIFKKFQDISPQAAQWLLREAEPKYWVDCYFPGRRYGHYTSNIAESLNSWLLAAREQPIHSMMETIREKMMGWFAMRREEGTKMQDEGFVPKVTKQLRQILDKARDYVVMPAVDSIFEVKSRQTGREYVVNLAQKTCTCFGFQATGYPCYHAARAILYHKHEVESYVDSCFKVAEYRKTYENGILPPAAALDLDTLPIFDPTEIAMSPPPISEPDINEDNDALLPPDTRRPAGRPKKRHIRHEVEEEPQRVLKCGRCRAQGHNRATCTNPTQYKQSV